MEDPILIAKIIGAVLTFALGIWIGLGTPGLGKPKSSRGARPRDRLNATWMNRVFFKVSDRPRRFDVGRLIDPEKEAAARQKGDEAKEEDREQPVVRLRRR